MNLGEVLFGGIINLTQGYLYTLSVWLLTFTDRSPLAIGWDLFISGGWVVFSLAFAYGLYTEVFLDYRSGQFVSKWKFTLLAIDIPKNNEQTPKAMENVFSALAGVFSGPNLIDKYWNAKVTESFSFEIVSIEGHTRFLIRTPNHFRDFIESVLYSQYPEAEINEVSDYVDYDSEYIDPKTGQPVTFRNLSFPNPLYNLWGTEFVLVKSYPYPIRTYPEFEHQQTQQLIDPMSNILEVLSNMGSGEQLWLQLVVQPRAPGWGEEAKKIVSKIQGKDYKAPESFDYGNIITKPVEGLMGWISGLLLELTGVEFWPATDEKKKEEDQWKMFKISPGERDVLIKVEKKISKQALKVKFRMAYIGKKGIFSKTRGVTGITGALQQFNTSDANAFKPGSYTKTAADYFFVDSRIAQRQNRLLRWFCNRTAWYGETNQEEKLTLLNPEELATLWHFPVMTVKAAQVEKIGSKKAAPPTRLPYTKRAAPQPKDERRIPRQPLQVAPIQPGTPLMDNSSAVISEVTTPQPIDYNIPSVAPVSPLATDSPVATAGQSTNAEAPNKKGAPPSNLPFV